MRLDRLDPHRHGKSVSERKKAKSVDQTSLGIAGDTKPRLELTGIPPSAIVHAAPQFTWGMSGGV